MADTNSTNGVLRIIRDRLLTFVPNQNLIGGDTRTLATRLGTYNAGGVAVDRLWLEAAPDDLPPNASGDTLWGRMQMIPSKQAGDDGGYTKRGVMEVQLFGRPRRTADALAGMADVVEQALFNWRHFDSEGGYIKVVQGLERTKIEYERPADRELYQINVRNVISYIPHFLSQYST